MANNEIEYRTMQKQDISKALELWQNSDGVHLHSNGEESCEGIRAGTWKEIPVSALWLSVRIKS